MKIEHVAIWTNNLEEQKEFYCKYFNGIASNKYTNQKKGFESYFISFEGDTRLEIMRMAGIPENKNDIERQYIGIIHLAYRIGSKEGVNELTEKLRADGYKVVGEARTTGDGYYESCILDMDGNRIEIIE